MAYVYKYANAAIFILHAILFLPIHILETIFTNNFILNDVYVCTCVLCLIL